MPEKKIDKNKTIKPRRAWSRNPVEKVHSTKKGKKGYSRPHEKQSTQKELID